MAGAWSDAAASLYEAGIAMIESAVRACPEALWAAGAPERSFWYTVFHVLFWTDVYLLGRYEDYAPPAPFTRDEMDPAGLYPSEPYAKETLLAFAAHCRAHVRSCFAALTDAQAAARCAIERHDCSVAEMHLYNLRHVQHHAGQLQLLLRQGAVTPPRWIGRGRDA